MIAKYTLKPDVSSPEMQATQEQMLQVTSTAVCSLPVDVVLTGEYNTFRYFNFNSIVAHLDCRYECQYLHRLPLPSRKSPLTLVVCKYLSTGFPDQLPDNSRDCFGREKHADYRDDMGGVGSFNRQNRTLYIGKIQESPDKKQMTETLLRHFGEWGKIVKCKCPNRWVPLLN